MKHIVLAVLLSILPTSVLACVIGEEWYNKKRVEFADYDSNKDGKWVFKEYLVYMEQFNIPEGTIHKSWENMRNSVTSEPFLTVDNFLTAQRPKCAGVASRVTQ